MTSIIFESVTKRFGANLAVNALDLPIQSGEFLVFVGPSGCGKTTSLRLLAGLETVSEGKIYIGDRLVNHVPPQERDIAMVFQSYALYPHMTVYENMAFGLQVQSLPRDEIRSKIVRAAQQMDIVDLLQRKPKELSGGQRQRVAVGRAIVRDPAVFLMDEPLSNLDAQLRGQARTEIIQLHRELGTTVVYVTHDQVEAMTMGTRIAVMHQGMLQQVDAPQTLYDHPKNRFVASFIGSPPMNFFSAQLTKTEEGIQVSHPAFQITIPPERSPQCQPHLDQSVLLGIRPNAFYDARFTPSNIAPIPLTATLTLLETLGNENLLHLKMANQETFVACVERRSLSLLSIGDRIPLVLDGDRIHLFDPVTEQCIL
jgi:multiple sugar transport system ATP-binding protein